MRWGIRRCPGAQVRQKAARPRPPAGPAVAAGKGPGGAGASQPACDTEGLRVWVYSQRSGGWVLP